MKNKRITLSEDEIYLVSYLLERIYKTLNIEECDGEKVVRDDGNFICQFPETMMKDFLNLQKKLNNGGVKW